MKDKYVLTIRTESPEGYHEFLPVLEQIIEDIKGGSESGEGWKIDVKPIKAQDAARQIIALEPEWDKLGLNAFAQHILSQVLIFQEYLDVEGKDYSYETFYNMIVNGGPAYRV